MRTLPALLLIVAVALLGTAAPAGAKAKPKTRYYLALGDSLAWGYELDAAGVAYQSPKRYAALLHKQARKQRRYRKLKLVNLGCPGENLATFADGGCIGQALAAPDRTRSQMDEALAWLKRHRKRTAFVTMSLGANEFTPCAKPAGVDLDCALAGLQSLKTNLPPIARALRAAAGRKVKIAIQTQYNPFLALVLQGGPYADLGLASVELARQANVAIRNAVYSSKFKIADVQAAFRATDTTTMVPLGGVQVPLAVAKVCELTQMCLPAPQGNIHPNDTGYALIARTFAKALKLK